MKNRVANDLKAIYVPSAKVLLLLLRARKLLEI